MSTFAFVFLCIQACLVQNVFGQYLGGLGCGCRGQALAPAATLGLSTGIAPACGSTLGLGSALGLGAYSSAIGSAFGGVLAPAALYGGAFAPRPAYGGAGDGNVAVAGELPVAGNTAVTGLVPIMGSVNFDGVLPAAGAVSIIGKCSCGCGNVH